MQKSYTKQLEIFGKEVKRLRRKHTITQQELAAKCDIDVRTIQRIEKGEHAVSLTILLALAKSFKLTPSELMGCLSA